MTRKPPSQVWADTPPFLRKIIAGGANLHSLADMPECQLTPEQVSKLAKSACVMSWAVAEWLLQTSVDLVPERRFDEKPYCVRMPVRSKTAG